MRRKWNPGETVDSFWLDIQTQVQYCGLRDEYHTDLILTTVWSNNFGDDETRKEFALNPKWSAVECYQRAKGLEQVRKERKGEFSVNAVRQSAYKQGGGKNVAKGAGKSTGGSVNSGGKAASGQKSGFGGPRGTSRSASCLNCGHDTHRNGVCPAQGQECKACGSVGHYARHCPAGRVNAVDDVEELRVCNAIQIEEEDDVGEVVVSKPPAARGQQGKTDWQEREYEVGNRCEVKDGEKWIAGTITGSYVANNGPRICAVLLDDTNEIWKMTTDNVVIKKRAEKGQWVPLKQPINGRGPRY
jgi:hypothetical protein